MRKAGGVGAGSIDITPEAGAWAPREDIRLEVLDALPAARSMFGISMLRKP